MVIGNGLIAKAFEPYGSSEKFLIFASGVSNSKSSAPEEYQKEKDLFLKTINENPEKTFVYFSTTSVNDPDLSKSSYVQHKLEMEGFVKLCAPNFRIVRLSNLAGHSKNRHTVLNFFNYQIMHERPFQCWTNAERNIIDISDVFKISDFILRNEMFTNETINIANVTNYKVPYIIHCLELFHHKKANLVREEKGSSFTIDISKVLPLMNQIGIHFDKEYLPDLLNKYFSKNDL